MCLTCLSPPPQADRNEHFGFSWDRERDMQMLQRKVDPKKRDEMIRGAGDLSSRFSQPKTQRNFL